MEPAGRASAGLRLMALVAVALGALIGLSLGLLGGGGSILAVPVLVYVAGLGAREAIAVSLLVVGVTSAVAAAAHARGGRVDLRAALLFGLAGMVGAPAGAAVSRLVPAEVLLLLFSLLMVVVGALMLRGSSDPAAAGRPSAILLPLAGLAVGLLTGLLGIGGGFLAVPALVLLARLPMPLAVGTSLAVIAANAFAGAAAHLGTVSLPVPLTAGFTLAAVAGALGGARLAPRIPPAALRRGFAVFVIVTGLSMGVHRALVAATPAATGAGR